MKGTLFPLIAGLGLLYVTQLVGIPGGSFIGAITGGALGGILYSQSKAPPARLQDFARLVLGVSIGVQVNEQTAIAAASSAIPVMLMVISLITTSLVFAWICTRLTGMNIVTSLCGSAPGAASAMILLADELKGDSTVVAVIHSIKILFIVAFMPALTRFFPAGGETMAITAVVSDTPVIYYTKLAFLIGASSIAAKLMRKVRFPTADFLGGLFFAALCNPLFLHLESFPFLVQLFSVWIVGTSIGTQMNRNSLRAIKKYAFACMILVIGLAVLGLLLGWLLHKFTSIGVLTALIGTCPTGMDAMIILANEMHTNVPLVAAMHCARVIVVMIVVPLLIRRAMSKKQKTS